MVPVFWECHGFACRSGISAGRHRSRTSRVSQRVCTGRNDEAGCSVHGDKDVPEKYLTVFVYKLRGVNDTFFTVIDMLIDNFCGILCFRWFKRVLSEQNCSGWTGASDVSWIEKSQMLFSLQRRWIRDGHLFPGTHAAGSGRLSKRGARGFSVQERRNSPVKRCMVCCWWLSEFGIVWCTMKAFFVRNIVVNSHGTAYMVFLSAEGI